MRHHQHRRTPRTLYALVWEDKGLCYIGQTTSLERRAAEHSRAWQDLGEFTVYELDCRTGTRLEVEEWEYAWRIRAHWSGYKIVGGSDVSGTYLVKPMKRATPGRLSKAYACKWPIRPFPSTLLFAVAVAVAVLLATYLV